MNMTNYNDITIPTFVINLKKRKDRKAYVEKQFCGRNEFELHIVEAAECENGFLGLWNSIKNIVQSVDECNKDDVIIICEDDHEFTENYERDIFLNAVIEGANNNANILIGGVSKFGNIVPLSKKLFWVDWFWSTQFLVIYKNAFNTILNEQFNHYDIVDDFLSKIFSNKILLIPFVSIQKSFGYSDCVRSDSERYNIIELFEKSKSRISEYIRVLNKYGVIDEM